MYIVRCDFSSEATIHTRDGKECNLFQTNKSAFRITMDDRRVVLVVVHNPELDAIGREEMERRARALSHAYLEQHENESYAVIEYESEDSKSTS